MADIPNVPPGSYYPCFRIRWDKDASHLDSVILSASTVKSNLDLLLWASKPCKPANDSSTLFLGPRYHDYKDESWIDLQGPCFTVEMTCHVMMSIVETNQIEKSGLFVQGVFLVKVPILDVSEDDKSIHECPSVGCRKTFNRTSNLKAHVQTHDPKRQRAHICQECFTGFCRGQGNPYFF